MQFKCSERPLSRLRHSAFPRLSGSSFKNFPKGLQRDPFLRCGVAGCEIVPCECFSLRYMTRLFVLVRLEDSCRSVDSCTKSGKSFFISAAACPPGGTVLSGDGRVWECWRVDRGYYLSIVHVKNRKVKELNVPRREQLKFARTPRAQDRVRFSDGCSLSNAMRL